MSNQIEPRMVVDIADRLLAFIDREAISSTRDLETRLDRRYDVEGHDNEFITIQKTPGGRRSLVPDSWVYTIDYIVEGKVAPIELRVNEESGYSTIIVKFAGTTVGYQPFVVDPYGNVAQAKNVESTRIESLKEELRKLKTSLSRAVH